MPAKNLEFKNANGETLAARLDLPVDDQPLAYALFAHCFTCSKNLKAVGNISRALNLQGIAVLRFDFTGLGESEGDFADTNFSSNVADLVEAAKFLGSGYEEPKILIGHSLGGAAVLQAAEQLPSVLAVATIGAPCSPDHVTHLLESRREEIEKNGVAEVVLAGRKFTIKKQFLDDLDQAGMKNRIAALNRALLVLHSPIDNTVGIENAAEIFQAAKHPKSFISLDTADHLLTEEADSVYAGTVIGAWARKYVDGLQTEKRVSAPGDYVMARTGRGFRTELSAGGHQMVADEPESYGGTDLGPSPYEFLSMALGACTGMTLRMYADRKEWPLEEVVVRLKHGKIHAEDCTDCETKTGKVDQIEREIEIIGDLDESQRNRILEIADKCPVHRTLHSEIKIRSRLKS